MNTITITEFRKNGNAVADSVSESHLRVTSRSGPDLRIRRFSMSDIDTFRQTWSDTQKTTSAAWREFFKTDKAVVVTLDGGVAFVVEQWSDGDK